MLDKSDKHTDWKSGYLFYLHLADTFIQSGYPKHMGFKKHDIEKN